MAISPYELLLQSKLGDKWNEYTRDVGGKVGIFFLKRNITLGEMKRHLRAKYVIPAFFLCGMTSSCFF